MVVDFVRVAREQLAGLAHDIGLTSRHRHDYEMVFVGDGLDWTFRCACGDETKDIGEAYRRMRQ
jgi:hypothetical protein